MSAGSPEELPEVVVAKGRGVSLVWLIPLIAVLVGGYMGWNAWKNRGIDIVITYPDAQWLEEGKTKIKFRSVDVGLVEEIKIAKGGTGVELHCSLDPDAEPYLTKSAMFWIEHPRVGGGQISGLGTLLSGAYLAMRLGDVKDEKQRTFAGLENPPIAPLSEGGLRIVLHADELYSISVGTRVYYLEEEVGKVEAYEREKDGRGFLIHLYFEKENEHLVHADSRFWNAGGLQVSASLGEISVKSPSLAAILAGGIAFDSPGGASAPKVSEGESFFLHPDRSALDTYRYRYGGLRIVVESGHLGGVKVGDRVSYRELSVGEVVSSELSRDSRTLRVELNIEDRYASLVRTNTVFWNASGISANLGLSGIHIHAESLEALLSGGVAFATPDPPGDRVKSGSVFELHPEVKDEWLKWHPDLWRGPARADPGTGSEAAKSAGGDSGGVQAAVEGEMKKAESAVAKFFHHKGKSEAEAAADAAPVKAPDAPQHEWRHGHLKRR